jgi:hypothetical protein
MEESMADEGKLRIFIASSKEGLPVANLIKETMDTSFDGAYCDIWDDPGVFEVSGVIIDRFQEALDVYAYAIIVLTPDDRTTIRGTQYESPRDNLIYELGLFTGRHGKDSVFIVTPQAHQIRLPSDLEGIITCNYKIRSNAVTQGYDVRTACNQIIRVIKKIEADKKSQIPRFSKKFWGDLSDIVVILYGAESPGYSISGIKAKPSHAKIKTSPRDIKAAFDIGTFLSRHHPRKKILTFPASTTGWQNLLHLNADLIIIGGFAANIEFKRHQSAIQKNFRLKRGRLCRMDGQRVYHVDFDNLLPGMSGPPREQPQEIGLCPSDYVSRDFGLVYSTGEHCYGSERRIIVIAGIKGNGTSGAALYLTHTDHLDSLLQNPVSKKDLLEIVIKTEVNNNVVNKTDIVEFMLNGKSLFDCPARWWEPCELNRQCEGCIFGETIPGK